MQSHADVYFCAHSRVSVIDINDASPTNSIPVGARGIAGFCTYCIGKMYTCNAQVQFERYTVNSVYTAQ